MAPTAAAPTASTVCVALRGPLATASIALPGSACERNGRSVQRVCRSDTTRHREMLAPRTHQHTLETLSRLGQSPLNAFLSLFYPTVARAAAAPQTTSSCYPAADANHFTSRGPFTESHATCREEARLAGVMKVRPEDSEVQPRPGAGLWLPYERRCKRHPPGRGRSRHTSRVRWRSQRETATQRIVLVQRAAGLPYARPKQARRRAST
eukprot:scaffold2261_cov405-Prasinococcus_capsulatus_cf.AAC.27